MADEVRPIDIERRRQRRAVGVRREIAAVAGEGAAQIGDQRVALPVGDRQKLRRDHVERLALRRREPAGIGVVAAGEFDRGLDQKAAGVIADRAERIVVDLEALARRLTRHRARHRRRERRLVRRRRRRNRQPQPRVRRERRWTAGTNRRLRPRLRGIVFWLLALAVERVVAGIGGTARGRQVVFRDLPDPRRRGFALVAVLELWAVERIVRLRRGPAQRRIRRHHLAGSGRAEQVRRDGLGARWASRQGDQRKARQGSAKDARAAVPAGCWPRPHEIKYSNENICLMICPEPNREHFVNGVKTSMVNEPLRAPPCASHRGTLHAKEGPGPAPPLPWKQTWLIRNR